MYEIEECIFWYHRLLDLMENDSEKIALGLQGDLLDAYRDLIERERTLLEGALQSLQNIY